MPDVARDRGRNLNPATRSRLSSSGRGHGYRDQRLSRQWHRQTSRQRPHHRRQPGNQLRRPSRCRRRRPAATPSLVPCRRLQDQGRRQPRRPVRRRTHPRGPGQLARQHRPPGPDQRRRRSIRGPPLRQQRRHRQSLPACRRAGTTRALLCPGAKSIAGVRTMTTDTWTHPPMSDFVRFRPGIDLRAEFAWTAASLVGETTTTRSLKRRKEGLRR